MLVVWCPFSSADKLQKVRMVQFHMFSFLLFSCLLQLLSAVDGSKHNGKCPPSFSCGNLGSISFPFTTTERPDCGILVIHACDDKDPEAVKTIKNRERWFSVSQVSQLPPTIVIKDDDFNSLLLSRSCDAFSYNISLNPSPFASFQIKYSLPIFRCDSSAKINPPSYFSKYTILCSATSNSSYDIYFSTLKTQESLSSKFPGTCSLRPLPTKDNQDLDDPFKFISAEIPLEVQVSPDCSSCYNLTGGQCQLDNTGKFFCAPVKARKIVHIVAPAASAAVILLLMALACCFRRQISLFLWKKKNPSHQIIETFLERCGHLPAKRYSYLEVKKVTNSFKNKLGQGGYGSVYKGKLPNGTLVAVKVLSELKGNGEEFINEVASISMTSHVNIVSLLGFCLEGSKRALIYEFMSNGSLEKFIYEEKDPLKLHLQLRSKIMYNIAIGVARGLKYLHRGCNTKILHFDIKPHNILLDDDFFPKISDFGLAKVCPQKESHISLFGARGTAGYIAPEVFSRNFGAVSHKSDVYSYGMMVLEMVGERKNINVEVDRSSELYFPHWIHNHLALNQELELKCIKNESDKEMVKKMIIVSLWCIQANPSNRPAMSKVVEMLEGCLESLQVPPKPVLSSPSTSPRHRTQTDHTSSS